MKTPTNCTRGKCPHNSMEGLPDFPGTKEVCTMHYECAKGYSKPEDCPLWLSKLTPREKILLWYKERKKR